MTDAQHLVLIGNFRPDRQESMQRFADVLQTGFSRRGWRVEVWAPEPKFANLAGPYRYGGLPKYLGYLDKFWVFPRRLRRRQRAVPQNAVFHIVDHGNAVYAPALARRPLFVTCHDLLQIRSALGEIPQNRVSKSGAKYQRWILGHLARLQHAVCVSKKTQEDLCRLTGLRQEAAPVIYMGLNYPYAPMNRDTAIAAFHRFGQTGAATGERLSAALRQGFLLGVGGAQWYKNRTGLVSVFAELRKRARAPQWLVYVGPPFDSEQQGVLEAAGAADAVIRLAGINNEDLRALYSLATALLFPSWEEGFGWPIAEAQACGCPVFTSNRAPMTEVGGSAARYMDPSAPASESAAFIAAELPTLAAVSAAGLAAARRWDTERMIVEYEQQYSLRVQEMARVAAVTS